MSSDNSNTLSHEQIIDIYGLKQDSLVQTNLEPINKRQHQKIDQATSMPHRKNLSVLYDLLKVLEYYNTNFHEPVSKNKMFTLAELTSKQGEAYLNRAIMMGYIIIHKYPKKIKQPRFPRFKITELGQQHIIALEKFHFEYTPILKASRRFGP